MVDYALIASRIIRLLKDVPIEDANTILKFTVQCVNAAVPKGFTETRDTCDEQPVNQ